MMDIKFELAVEIVKKTDKAIFAMCMMIIAKDDMSDIEDTK